MKTLTEPPWSHLESLPGQSASGPGFWRKRVHLNDAVALLVQTELCCGIKRSAWLLESAEEIDGWREISLGAALSNPLTSRPAEPSANAPAPPRQAGDPPSKPQAQTLRWENNSDDPIRRR